MVISLGTKVFDNQENSYILDEILGSGGFGNVYKAHCENDGTIVAIKMIDNIFDNDDAFLSFQKETNLVKLIASENIIKYLYVHDGNEFIEYPPYIIMEYTNGGTLRDLINNQKGVHFDIEILKSIYLQLARGMKCVSKCLVHRDIKPENILNFNGVLKITDFGLSKVSGENTKTMTFKNFGTPLYIAPEAWNNDHNTVQMDIYSMGIVFYELATLSYPYVIPAKPDYFSFRDMHLYDAVINPVTKNRALPPTIVSMIIKMLEKPTQRRFSNWDEIISILESDSAPKDDLAEIVNKAILLRNEKDLERQEQQATKEKAENAKKEYIKLAYSQYCSVVSKPIHEFVSRFDSQYHGVQKITIKESEPMYYNPRFSTVITMTTGQRITITGEVLLKENFTKKEKSFLDEYPREVNYIPQCKGRDIILWCQLADSQKLGFNILLLKNNDGIYGDWFILENSIGALTRTNRPSPFGFELSELPKEINYINALHIYNLNLQPYSKEKLLEYITGRI